MSNVYKAQGKIVDSFREAARHSANRYADQFKAAFRGGNSHYVVQFNSSDDRLPQDIAQASIPIALVKEAAEFLAADADVECEWEFKYGCPVVTELHAVATPERT